MIGKQEYLGDGVYARYDGYYIWLQAEDAMGFENNIAIEDSVLEALNEFYKRQIEEE